MSKNEMENDINRGLKSDTVVQEGGHSTCLISMPEKRKVPFGNGWVYSATIRSIPNTSYSCEETPGAYYVDITADSRGSR